MDKLMTVGLDLAKNVFHLVSLDSHGKVVRKNACAAIRSWPNLSTFRPVAWGWRPAGGAHYWARELGALGHEVKLHPAQHVKPYVRGNKNDYNDALAIAEAYERPQMHSVAVKTPEQQDIQALHRLRERRVQERTGLCNQLRGLLAEYGQVLPKGVASLRRKLPELLADAENDLSELLRRLLAQARQQLQEARCLYRGLQSAIRGMPAPDDDTGLWLEDRPSLGKVVAMLHSMKWAPCPKQG